MTQRTWGIVGGGFLGMTLALRLAQRGERVTLFEAADHLGGLADAWELGDIVWDRHYHVILQSDHYLLKLIDELGLTEELRWNETKTGFWVDGELHSMSNTREFLRFPPLGLVAKLRLGFTIWYCSRIRNWRKLESIRADAWLRKLSGRSAYEKMWVPLLRAKLGENASTVSAAWIWAIIARMYAARRGGAKREVFGFLGEGYARMTAVFHARLAELGVDVRLASAVSGVERDSAGARVHLASGASESFERVVLTTPAPLVPKLCSGLAPAEEQRLNGITYQGIVCTSLLLRKPLAEYYVTNVADTDFPFTGVIELTALVPPATFHGRSIVYLPRYLPEDHTGFEVDDAELREQVTAALGRMYPAFEPHDILAFRVSRTRRVLALTTLDYSAHMPPILTSIPGVYVVTSAQIANGTLNVNETVKLAEEALETLTNDALKTPSDNKERDAASDRQLVAGS